MQPIVNKLSRHFEHSPLSTHRMIRQLFQSIDSTLNVIPFPKMPNYLQGNQEEHYQTQKKMWWILQFP